MEDKILQLGEIRAFIIEAWKITESSHVRILQAEHEYLDGAETITISEARKRLRERILDNNK